MVVAIGIWAEMGVEAEVQVELEVQLVAGAWATECTFLYISAFLYDIIIYIFFLWVIDNKKSFSRICWSPARGEGSPGALVKC